MSHQSYFWLLGNTGICGNAEKTATWKQKLCEVLSHCDGICDIRSHSGSDVEVLENQQQLEHTW